MHIIEINGLTKDYGGHKGIFNLNFAVKEGEVFGYLGPNGAGKTTTIRHLMGFLTPDKGSSQILGMDCRAKSSNIMEQLGYLPGEMAFFEGMKGIDFLKFMASLRGMRDTSYRDKLIDLFQLDTSGRIRKMSKGMKQKLGIVCAFMHDPRVLILDEPTSGLDPLMQKTFADLILKERAKGKTILMSSHSFEEIERTCDRAGIIREGELVAVEDIHNLRQKRRKTYLITFDSPKTALAFVNRNNSNNNELNGSVVKTTIQGNVTQLLKSLEEYTVLDFDTENSSLEDIFMQYYGSNQESAGLAATGRGN